MSVTFLGHGVLGDSGIDLDPGDGSSPSSAPRRPPRRSRTSLTPDRDSQRASGLYGFFDPEQLAGLETGSGRHSFQAPIAGDESAPDWDFEIVEEEEEEQPAAAMPTPHEPIRLPSKPDPTPASSVSAARSSPPVALTSEPTAPTSRRTQTAENQPDPPVADRLTFVPGKTIPPPDSRTRTQAEPPSKPPVPPAAAALPSQPPAPAEVAAPAPEESIVRSRTGTVVGRKGTVGNLRERFQRRSPAKAESGASAAPAAPTSLVKSRRESGNGAMIESEEAFTSRRGSVLLKKGMVGQWKNIFHRKAHDLVTPKTLAEELAEREQALGTKLGGCLVVYTSSTTMVRETYSDCQRALRILQNYRCKFEERDVMLSRQFQTELRERCPNNNSVPQVFLNGAYLGNAETIERLNEDGKLTDLIASVPRFDAGEGPCETCAGRGMVVCEWCGGDRKSVMSRFGRETVKLRCTVCNEHGLQPCPECRLPQSEA